MRNFNTTAYEIAVSRGLESQYSQYRPQSKQVKEPQFFDKTMVGDIQIIGANSDMYIEFTEKGKYYARSGWNYVYLGQWSNREKVFEFLKVCDRFLNLVAEDIADVETAVCTFFKRNPKYRYIKP